MNAVTQPLNSTTGADRRGHLEIAKTDIEFVMEESEKMREQIRMQANEVGPVLEALLHDTHGHIQWGLNE